MIMFKIINAIFFLLLLNGCVQNSAFLGPALTMASTGSVLQAGLSHGSNEVIKKITGKTTIENIKEALASSENENKIRGNIKRKIRKVSKIKDLSSQ